jgi:hypothetical protein
MKALSRATGLRPAPRHLPARQQSTEDLRVLQRMMTHVLVRPLTSTDGMQKKWIDGRPMAKVAAEFIKPNDRLSSFERLQLYNRMYWFRLIDCVYDDNPGMHALLGDRKFFRLTQAYLAKYPSRSFSLRNLCSRLEQFITEEPHWTAPRTTLARQVARFEWAQTVAFDGEKRPVLAAADIARIPPARLRLGLQPYLSLLALDWPVDDYVIAVKKRVALRSEASNAVDHGPRAVAGRKVAVPRRGRVYVVVHRYNNQLYYKRLEAPAFRMIEALQAGRSVAQAVAAAGPRVEPTQVRDWFTTWMGLGWFCRRK